MASVASIPTASKRSRTARLTMFVLLAAGGLVLDLATKSYVFGWLGRPDGTQHIHWFVEGWFGLETALNHGALFGAMQNMVWLFATMAMLAVGGIVYWLSREETTDDFLLTATLGIVTGGVLGNLYDRLGLWSDFQIFAVRDWIRFSYPLQDAAGNLDVTSYVWPNFNIADSLLVCGAALLVYHSIFCQPQSSSGSGHTSPSDKQSEVPG